MPNLGHAARLRAHIRPIGKAVRTVLGIAPECEMLGDLIVSAANHEDIPWEYDRPRSVNTDAITYVDLGTLIQSHEEIAAKLQQWEERIPDERELEEAASQMEDLAAMAWKFERMNRGQGNGSNYLTLDVDPVTVRLLAMTGAEREKRAGDGYEANMILEESRFSKILRKDHREQVKLARSTLQEMINVHGNSDSGFSEEHTVVASEIPHMSGYRIEVKSGSVRSVSRYSGGPVRWINSDRIALNVKLPETARASIDGTSLDGIVSHPITQGLGIAIEKTSLLTDVKGQTHEIRTDAWRRNKLIAMVINLNQQH